MVTIAATYWKQPNSITPIKLIVYGDNGSNLLMTTAASDDKGSDHGGWNNSFKKSQTIATLYNM